ncbi:hypothetical protein PILCRDRAFT_16209 [Piloderma croceum F 1598]|uniref:Uncharacterized protein n=1 Tax=Piloderma croceum (strain F 1598) TaxID=765440 RepID=A0A0C3EI82_PILCF|nr:hypothetical protein PILCRDRAFT_16209 [Piloderma croceum F 1598]
MSSPAYVLPTLFPNISTIYFCDLELCTSLPVRALKHVSIDTTHCGLTKTETEELFAALDRHAGKTVIELRLVGERLPRVRMVRYYGIISRFHRPELDPTELLHNSNISRHSSSTHLRNCVPHIHRQTPPPSAG